MRYCLIFLTTAVFLPALASTQQQHRWAPLVLSDGQQVDVDTVTIRSLDGVRQVWLRWHFNRWPFDRGPHLLLGNQLPNLFPSYQLEQRDLDCAKAQTRVLTKVNFYVDDTGRANTAPVTASESEAAWHRPSSGSLVSLALAAACRWK